IHLVDVAQTQVDGPQRVAGRSSVHVGPALQRLGNVAKGRPRNPLPAPLIPARNPGLETPVVGRARDPEPRPLRLAPAGAQLLERALILVLALRILATLALLTEAVAALLRRGQLHRGQAGMLELRQVVLFYRDDDGFRGEPGGYHRVDRGRLLPLNRRDVLLVVAQERHTPLVEPQPVPLRRLDDGLQLGAGDPPQWTQRAVGELALGRRIVAGVETR